MDPLWAQRPAALHKDLSGAKSLISASHGEKLCTNLVSKSHQSHSWEGPWRCPSSWKWAAVLPHHFPSLLLLYERHL